MIFLPLMGAVDCLLFDFNPGLDLSSDSSVLVPSKPLVLTGLSFCTVVARGYFLSCAQSSALDSLSLVFTGLTIFCRRQKPSCTLLPPPEASVRAWLFSARSCAAVLILAFLVHAAPDDFCPRGVESRGPPVNALQRWIFVWLCLSPSPA
jgi:hypothetical protein